MKKRLLQWERLTAPVGHHSNSDPTSPAQDRPPGVSEVLLELVAATASSLKKQHTHLSDQDLLTFVPFQLAGSRGVGADEKELDNLRKATQYWLDMSSSAHQKVTADVSFTPPNKTGPSKPGAATKDTGATRRGRDRGRDNSLVNQKKPLKKKAKITDCFNRQPYDYSKSKQSVGIVDKGEAKKTAQPGSRSARIRCVRCGKLKSETGVIDIEGCLCDLT